MKFRKNQRVYFPHCYAPSIWPCVTGTVISRSGNTIYVKADTNGTYIVNVDERDVEDLLKHEYKFNRFMSKQFKNPFYNGLPIKYWFKLIVSKIDNILFYHIV